MNQKEMMKKIESRLSHGEWANAPIRQLKTFYYARKEEFALKLSKLQAEHYALVESYQAILEKDILLIEAEPLEPYLPYGAEDKVENYWLCAQHASGIIRFPLAALRNQEFPQSMKGIYHFPNYYPAVPWRLLKPLDAFTKGHISAEEFRKTLVKEVVGIQMRLVDYYYDTLLPWVEQHWAMLEDEETKRTLGVMVQHARNILKDETKEAYSMITAFYSKGGMVLTDLTVGRFWPENEKTNPLIGETLTILMQAATERSIQHNERRQYDLLTKRNIPPIQEYLDTLRQGLIKPENR